jgi:hypothetical protein
MGGYGFDLPLGILIVIAICFYHRLWTGIVLFILNYLVVLQEKLNCLDVAS